jgi:hypothetical protein
MISTLWAVVESVGRERREGREGRDGRVRIELDTVERNTLISAQSK